MDTNSSSPNRGSKPKRPFRVTLLVLAVLSIAIIHLIRFVQAIHQWGFLESWPGVSPLYLALTGFIWGVVGLPLVWGLWRGNPWALVAFWIFILVYVVYAWIDRIFVANVEITMSQSSASFFLALATLFILALAGWITTNAKTKAFFRRDT